MTRYLVTGANGFVGTALCARLSRDNVDVVAAVRTATSSHERAVGDIGAHTDWNGLLHGCDGVIHLAARVHIMADRAQDPLAAFRATNTVATIHLARQAAAAGVKRFVFVSSVKVNGEQAAVAYTAADNPHPEDPYGQSKLEAEQGLRSVAAQTGLEVVIVRPPLVYGPGVGANFLRLMQLVKRGLPLPLGAVDNRRSMVALENLVDLLVTCAQHGNASGQTFMVSDGEDISTTRLIRMLAASMHRPARLLPVSPQVLRAAASLLGQSDVASRLLDSLTVDITQTREVLQWQPPIKMAAAIDATVAHFLLHKAQAS